MDEVAPDWAALYLAHKDAMHKVARTVLRRCGLSPEDHADDVVQEAMRSLMARPPKTPRKGWEAVMVTAAKYKALDFVRSAGVRHAGPELGEALYRREDYLDLAEDVVEDLERQQLAGRVRAAMSVLSERSQQVVWRRAALEEPRKKVASDLGVSPGRVTQITEKALEDLRVKMGGQLGGG